MFTILWNALMGCTHSRTTFPITPARKVGFSTSGQSHGTYVVCLDCGKEFAYNWADMRIGEPVVADAAPKTTLSPAHR
jgi:hypothetical protein